MTNKQILFSYIDPESVRETLRSPICHGDYVYGADGHIAIKARKSMFNVECTDIKDVPDLLANQLINIFIPREYGELVDDAAINKLRTIHDSYKAKIEHLTDEYLDEIVKCTKCKGTGYVDCTCPDCGDEHDSACSWCYETGTIRRGDLEDTNRLFRDVAEFQGFKCLEKYLSIIYETICWFPGEWRFWISGLLYFENVSSDITLTAARNLTR